MYGVCSTVPYSAVCMMYPHPLPSLNNDEMTDMNDGGAADGKKGNKAGKRGVTETVNHLPAPGLTVTLELKTKNQNQTSSGKRQSQRQPAFQHPGSRSSIIRLPLLRQSHRATTAVECVGETRQDKTKA